MRISAVNSYINNRNFYNNKTPQKSNINFGHHPDFMELSKEYMIMASSYFRRGPYFGSPCEEFKDIVNLFKTIFDNQIKNPKKMLIGGIGRSEEPFSYLAVIKELTNNQKLKDVVDLSTVDLQSKPKKNTLFENSFYEFTHCQPEYAPTSFIYDPDKVPYRSYRINNEILDFVGSTYNNAKKSLWETQLQEAIKQYPAETFDIISFNNTIGYIKDIPARVNTVRNIHRILKPNGIYITDPYYNNLEEAKHLDRYEKISRGIYRKK